MNERPTKDAYPIPPYHAAITDSRTYVEYDTGEKELYDRDTAPYELSNAYEPSAPPALASRLQALEGCAGDACRTAENGP